MTVSARPVGALDRRDVHPLERRLERAHRVELDDDDDRTQGPQRPREAAAAPAEAHHGERLPRDERVRGAHEAVHRGEPDAALVLEGELDRAVIDDDDRVPHAPGELADEAIAAGRRLLGGGHHARGGILDAPRDQVGTVVQEQAGVGAKHARDVLAMCGHVVGLHRVDAHAASRRHGRGDAVVGRRGTRRPDDLCAAGDERIHEHRGLRLDVETHADAPTGKRAIMLERGAQASEHRRVRARPGDARVTRGGERRIGDEARLETRERDRGRRFRGNPCAASMRTRYCPDRGHSYAPTGALTCGLRVALWTKANRAPDTLGHEEG